MMNPIAALVAGEIRPKDKVATGPVTPPLSVGEVVEATVEQRRGDKFLITVKGMLLEASSALPLGEGQKITVRISQLFPKILMIPVGEGDPAEGSQHLLEQIRTFKQDPAMLKNIFTAGKDLLSAANIKKYQEWMPGTDFSAIKASLESLLFSKDTLGEYAGKLGLIHEHAIASGKGTSDNLKAMLMNLQQDIQAAVSEKGSSGNALAGLSEFAASTIGKIESYQAVNLMSLEKDGLFFLPLLFLFNEEIRTGEFYAGTKETARGKELKAVLFMDMDRLGKIIAEAGLLGNSMKCSFRCENPETRDFLSERMPLLKDGLEALGYKAKDINFFHERNMDAARLDLWEELPAYNEGVLNIKA